MTVQCQTPMTHSDTHPRDTRLLAPSKQHALSWEGPWQPANSIRHQNHPQNPWTRTSRSSGSRATRRGGWTILPLKAEAITNTQNGPNKTSQAAAGFKVFFHDHTAKVRATRSFTNTLDQARFWIFALVKTSPKWQYRAGRSAVLV